MDVGALLVSLQPREQRGHGRLALERGMRGKESEKYQR